MKFARWFELRIMRISIAETGHHLRFAHKVREVMLKE